LGYTVLYRDDRDRPGGKEMAKKERMDVSAYIGADLTPEQARAAYDSGLLPAGWYTTGRRTGALSESENQSTRRVDVADHYSGTSGTVVLWSPTVRSRIIDVRNPETTASVAADVLAAYNNGDLPYALDELIATELHEYGAAETIDRLRASLNPNRIVESAEFFDDPAATEWFVSQYDCDVVYTTDGAIAFGYATLRTHTIHTKH
jgi:hypothetical protein